VVSLRFFRWIIFLAGVLSFAARLPAAGGTYDVKSGALLVETNRLTGMEHIRMVGYGVLSLEPAGTNDYLGFTWIDEGVVRTELAGPSVGLSSNSHLRLDSNDGNTRSAVLETRGTFERNIGAAAGEVQWQNNGGGFAARGGPLTVRLEGGSELLWSDGNRGFSGKKLDLGSYTADHMVELVNDIHANVNASVIVHDNPDSPADLGLISGTITNNNDTLSFRKRNGLGTLWLTATNDYGGDTIIDYGSLRAIDGVGLPSRSQLYLEGENDSGPCAFESSGTFARDIGNTNGNYVYWGSRGGFAAWNGPLNVNLEGGATLQWADPDIGFNNQRLHLGSRNADDVVTFENDIDGGAVERTVDGWDNPHCDADYGRFTGALTNFQRFRVRGDGTVVIAGELRADASNADWIGINSGTLKIEGSALSGRTNDWPNALQEFYLWERGSLIVNGSIAGRFVEVQANAAYPGQRRLGGNGTLWIRDQVSVRDGGVLAPGDGGAGTLSIVVSHTNPKRLELQNGATYEWELGPGGQGDSVAITGDLRLWSTWTLQLKDAGGASSASDEHEIFTYTRTREMFGVYEIDTSLVDGNPRWDTSGVTLVDDTANKRVYLTGLVVSAAEESGNTLTWDGGGSGDWGSASWTGGPPAHPGIANRAVIASTGQTVTVEADHAAHTLDLDAGLLAIGAGNSLATWDMNVGENLAPAVPAGASLNVSNALTLGEGSSVTFSNGSGGVVGEVELGMHRTLQVDSTNVSFGSVVLSGGELEVGAASLEFSSQFRLSESMTLDYDLRGSGKLVANERAVLDRVVTLSGHNTYGGATEIWRAVLDVGDVGEGLSPNSAVRFLSFNNQQPAVVQGYGTLSRDVGTGSGEISWDGGCRGGFSARGGDLTVKLQGGAELCWSTGTPGLNQGNNVGALQFGSLTADGMVELANDIRLEEQSGRIQVQDNPGTKTDFVRLSGDIGGGGMDWFLRFNENAGNYYHSTLVEFTGHNTYSHGTLIDDCTIYGLAGAGLSPNSLLRFDGNTWDREAVVMSSGNITREIGDEPGEVYWQEAGGFAARGGTLTVNLEGGAELVTDDLYQGFRARALQLNSQYADSMVDFQNDIMINGTDWAYFYVFDNEETDADFGRVSGVIRDGSSGGLRKRREGTLWLSASNTYTQPTVIDYGALRAIDGVGLPAGSQLYFEGDGAAAPVVFESSGEFTREIGNTNGNYVFWGQQGGFAAYGGKLTVSLEGGIELDTRSADTGFNGVAGDRNVHFGSRTANDVVEFQNDILLNSSMQRFYAWDNPHCDTDYCVLSGDIRYTTWGDIECHGNAPLTLTGKTTIRNTRVYDTSTLMLNGAHTATDQVYTEGFHFCTIGGTGTLAVVNRFDVRQYGRLTPGYLGAGTLGVAVANADGVRLYDKSTYEWELGAQAYDKVAVGGNLELRLGWTLKLLGDGGTPVATNEYDIFTYTGNLIYFPPRIDVSEVPSDWDVSGLRVERDATEGRVYITGVYSTLGIANLPATDLTSSSAQLNGTLSCSDSEMLAWVYWGETDGGTDAGAWSNKAYIGKYISAVDVSLSHAATGLATNTTYFYTFQATNTTTEFWARPSESFTALGPPVVDDGGGATGISPYGTARLRGSFLDHNRGEVTICWGLSDGGTNSPADWKRAEALGLQSAAEFSALAEGAYYPLTYHYRCYASNDYGTGWSHPATSFTMDVTPSGVPILTVTEGLGMWLDAQDIDGDGDVTDNPSDGATVLGWGDRSGAGHPADVLEGGDPRYKTDGPNGMPVVSFDDDYLHTTYDFDGFSDAYTVFAVSRYAGVERRRVIGSDSRNWLFGHHGNMDECWHAEGWINNTGVGNTNWHLYAGTINGAVDPEAAFWKEGNLLASGNTGSHNTNYKPGRIGLGGWNSAGNQDSDCEIAEVLLYDSVLSSNELNEVGSYLAAKYGLTTAYPPYRGPTCIAVRNAQPTERSLTTARINAVIDLSNAVYDVWAYWGASDGGSNAAAWASNSFMGTCTSVVGETVGHTIGGLTALSTPFYTFQLTNAVESFWASPSTNVLAVVAPEVENDAGAVTNVGSAVLRGNLATGNVADVYIYWGRSDGGTNPLAWESCELLSDVPEGAFAAQVTAGYGFDYFYRCYATNAVGDDWADLSRAFSTTEPPDAMYTYGEGLRESLFFGAPRDDTRLNLGGSSYAVSFDRIFTGDKPGTVLQVAEDPNNNVVGRGVIQHWDQFPLFNGNAENFVTAVGGRIFPRTTGTHNFRFDCDDRAWMWIDMDDNGVFDVGENVGTYNWRCGNPGAGGGDGTKELSAGRGYNFVAMAQEYGGGQSFNWFVTEPGKGETRVDTVGQAPLWQYATNTWQLLCVANGSESDVSTNSATLNGTLTGLGWALDVWVHWGGSDGGTNAGDWDNSALLGCYTDYDGAVSHAVSGLAAQTGYYYAFRATNNVTNIWAAPSEPLQTLGGSLLVSNRASVGVSQTQATLRGELVAGGSGDATIYWGLDDGGTNHTSWSNASYVGSVGVGPFGNTVPVLAGATYRYRCYVTNAFGDAWADSSATFTAAVPAVSLSIATVREEIPFDPLGIPGCELWLAADDIDGDGDRGDNPAHGTTVDLWYDKSGYGRDAIREGVTPAVYNANGPNGRGVVTFDGDYMSSSHNFDSLTEYTVLSVARYTGGTSARVISSRTRNWMFGFHGNGDQRFYAEGWIHSSGTANTNWHIHAGHIDSDADPKASFWKDGVNLVTDGTGSGNANYMIGRLGLGGYRAGSEESDCEIAELLIYNRVLIDEELGAIGFYLDWKYGVSTPYSDSYPAVVLEARGGYTVTARLSAPSISNVTVNFDFGTNGYAYPEGMRGSIFVDDIYNDNAINLDGAAYAVSESRVFTGDKAGTVLALEEDRDWNVIATGTIQDWSQFPGFNYNIDQFATVFSGTFVPRTSGEHTFRGQCDDKAFMYIDVAGDGVWDNSDRVFAGNASGTKTLSAGQPYNFIYMHREGGGGQNINWYIAEPGCLEERVDTAEQPGMWLCAVPGASVSNDYTVSAASVVIPAGGMSTNISVSIVDDLAQEDDEAVSIGIGSLVNATNGRPDRVAGSVGSRDPRVTHGDGASDVAGDSATLNGVLTMGAAADVTLYWGDADGGTDHASWGATVVVGAVSEDRPFATSVTGLVAGTIYYYRCYATNCSNLAQDWADATTAFTNAAALAIDDAWVVEGDAGSASAVFTITASATGVTDVSVGYGTAAGTAQPGADYTAVSGRVTLAAGDISTQFVVQVTGDTELEHPDELFTVYLANPTNCTMADAQGTCRIVDDDANDYLKGFPSRMRITVEGYSGGETLVNFPVLVRMHEKISRFEYRTFASPTGGDLRFVDATGKSLLSHEIEEWNTNGESCVWVSLPLLPPGGTYFWARWGNEAETTAPGYTSDGSTWSDGYLAVWHLAEEKGALSTRAPDSSPGAHDGTLQSMNPSVNWVDGVIANSLNFDPVNDNRRINVGSLGKDCDETTFSFWTRPGDGGERSIFHTKQWIPGDLHCFLLGGDNFRVAVNGAGFDSPVDYCESIATLPDDQWTHWTVVYSVGAQTARMYKNGALDSTNAFDEDKTIEYTHGIYIGANNAGNSREMVGRIDELRIEDVARSADWIKASYDNQRLGSDFVEYSDAFTPEGMLLLIR